ncbi:hypothetical protein [Microbispora bryophytorum]|uniref:hypothetical protein n=1 Tax=Microbispora bryophytorum TaxID=1460882 RepID=UPI0033D2C6D7
MDDDEKHARDYGGVTAAAHAEIMADGILPATVVIRVIRHGDRLILRGIFVTARGAPRVRIWTTASSMHGELNEWLEMLAREIQTGNDVLPE